MGTLLKVLSESNPMNTIMTEFRWFSKMFASLFFRQKISLSIGRVKPMMDEKYGIERETHSLQSVVLK